MPDEEELTLKKDRIEKAPLESTKGQALNVLEVLKQEQGRERAAVESIAQAIENFFIAPDAGEPSEEVRVEPSTLEEYEKRLEDIRQKHSQARQEQDELRKQTAEILDRITKRTLRNSADISGLSGEIDALRTITAARQRLCFVVNRYVKDSRTLEQRYKVAILKEAGVDSDEQLREALDAGRAEVKKLKQHFVRNLLFNKNKKGLADAIAKKDKIEDFLLAYGSYHPSLDESDAIDKKAFVGVISKKVFDVIESSYNARAQELQGSLPKADSQGKPPEGVEKAIRREYVESVAQKRLEKYLEDRRRSLRYSSSKTENLQGLKEAAMPKNFDRAVALLDRGLEICNAYGFQADSDYGDKERAFWEEVGRLPEVLREGIRKSINGNKPKIEELRDRVGFLKHSRIYSDVIDLQDRRQTAYDAFQAFVDRHPEDLGRLRTDIEHVRKGYEYPLRDTLDEADKNIAEISPALFVLCVKNETIRNWIGPDTLALAEELMHERTVVHVRTHRQHTNESNDWGWRLMRDHRAEDIPLILLMAFRETGHSGDMPFVNNEGQRGTSILGSVLKGLRAEDVEAVRTCGIPGIAEVVNLARQYPSKFTEHWSHMRRTQGSEWERHIDNPIYQRVRRHLVEAAVYHLRSDDRSMQAFVMGLLHRIGDEYTTPELYSALIDAMKSNTDLQKDGAEVISRWMQGEEMAPHEALRLLITESNFRDPIFPAATKAVYQGAESLVRSISMWREHSVPEKVAEKYKNIKEQLATTLSLVLEKIADAVAAQNAPDSDGWTKFVLIGSETVLNLARAARALNIADPQWLERAKILAKSPDENAAFLGLQLLDMATADLKPWKNEIFNILRRASKVEDVGSRDSLYTNGKDLVGALVSKAIRQFDVNDRALLADAVLNPEAHGHNHALYNGLLDAFEHSGEAPRDHMDRSDSNRTNFIRTQMAALTEQNWAPLLLAYIELEGERLRLPADVATGLNKLFSTRENPESSEFVIARLRQQFELFLSGGCEVIPFEALMVADAVHQAGGAGPLKYVEALCDLMQTIRSKFARPLTAPATKEAIRKGLQGFEQTFREGKKKDRWSEDDKAAFYHLSGKVIDAAPSLYTDFLQLFEVLSARENKEFSRDIFPLYQAWMVLLQKRDASGEGTISPGRDLVKIRRNINELAKRLAGASDEKGRAAIFESARVELLEALKSTFQQRFGIIRVPEAFSEEDIRTLQDSILYLSNMSNKTDRLENILGFYLALRLNGLWDAFRRGEQIDAAGLMDGAKLNEIQEFLAARAEKSVLTVERLGISQEQLFEFQRILQDETLSLIVGNVATIDIRLGNAKRNLEALSDEDAYPDPLDKVLFRLANEHGKRLGGILKDLFLMASGKSAGEFSAEHEAVSVSLRTALDTKDLTVDQVQDLQKRLRPISSITSLVQSFEESDVDGNIEELKSRLVPPAEVVDIFNRLGESFSVTSGAMALSQDLGYLENLVVKHDKDLTDFEKRTLSEYLERVRSQMKILEAQLDHAKEGFTALKRSIHAKSSPILASRFTEIESALYAREDSSELTTRVTNNLNYIIENIRQCLGCKRKEINNDTNVTFGDSNKFFVMSQATGSEKSVADQILLLAPLAFKKEGEVREELSFIFDTLYGAKSADVLVGHVAAVIKKYTQLIRRFPEAKLSVFVTAAALSTAGVSEEVLKRKLEEEQKIGVICELNIEAAATVTESAAGDHYIEIGDTARKNGPRNVKGIRITLESSVA